MVTKVNKYTVTNVLLIVRCQNLRLGWYWGGSKLLGFSLQCKEDVSIRGTSGKKHPGQREGGKWSWKWIL